MDGASYATVFFKIILPLSLPMITTLGLFQAVWHWNDWFMGSFYVKELRLRPLQTYLRYAIVPTDGHHTAGYATSSAHSRAQQIQDPRLVAQLLKVTPETMKLTYIVITTVPILLVYPFIQKYFIKGVLIGSIKE